MKSIASSVLMLVLLLLMSATSAQESCRSEDFGSYRGKTVTFRGTAYPMASNALTRSVSGCGVLLDAANASFAVHIGSPRTSWAQFYIPCETLHIPDGQSRHISITGTLETWYPGKLVRGANVRPMYISLKSVFVSR